MLIGGAALSVATKRCVLSALLPVASGCAATPESANVDSLCLVVAEPPITTAWVDGADQAWVDWLVPIADYGQRNCGWR